MSPVVVETRGLGKRYSLGAGACDSLRETISSGLLRRGRSSRRDFWALRGVDLTIHEGESVGVVGRNGAGKSTLLRLLARITEPSEGVARTRGRVGTLLEVGTGFHPELTGRENVFLNGAVLGLPRREIARRFDAIATFSGVERFLETPLKRYSTGMQLRLAFAVAAHLDPEILVVDEVLAVGDAEFQQRCLGRISELTGDGRTVLFVSHDLGAVARLCRRAVWLDHGEVRDAGPAEAIVAAYTADHSSGELRVAEARDPDLAAQVLEVSVAREALASGGGVRRDVPLAIDIRFAVEDSASDVDLAIWLRNDRGVNVLDDRWSDDGRRPPGPLARGSHVARIVVPPILSSGTYGLGVWLGSAHEDFAFREYLTIVIAPHPHDSSEQIARDRAACPEVLWQVEERNVSDEVRAT